MSAMSAAELRGLLIRNWLTHDAMWFATAVDTLGVEQANRLNRTAARSMAVVEAKRLRRLIGMDEVRTGAEFRRFFDFAIDTVIPDFMDFGVHWTRKDTVLDLAVTKCFAYDGVKMLGVADAYECGTFERVRGWLEGLRVAFTETPLAVLCTMHHEGTCGRRFALELPTPPRRS